MMRTTAVVFATPTARTAERSDERHRASKESRHLCFRLCVLFVGVFCMWGTGHGSLPFNSRKNKRAARIGLVQATRAPNAMAAAWRTKTEEVVRIWAHPRLLRSSGAPLPQIGGCVRLPAQSARAVPSARPVLPRERARADRLRGTPVTPSTARVQEAGAWCDTVGVRARRDRCQEDRSAVWGRTPARWKDQQSSHPA